MNLKKEKLTSTLKNLIKATEANEILTSEEFLNQLIDELHMNKIITFEESANK